MVLLPVQNHLQAVTVEERTTIKVTIQHFMCDILTSNAARYIQVIFSSQVDIFSIKSYVKNLIIFLVCKQYQLEKYNHYKKPAQQCGNIIVKGRRLYHMIFQCKLDGQEPLFFVCNHQKLSFVLVTGFSFLHKVVADCHHQHQKQVSR